ncbi:MAG: TcmI family type II polyketide cyclase [Streptomycetaceae bacterium]|nr:TcmI family type II polyketide cyclase [Streptomycetaceae bacterium]
MDTTVRSQTDRHVDRSAPRSPAAGPKSGPAADGLVRGDDGAKLRVLLMLEIHEGSQERFLDAYESIRAQVAAVPGHLRDQLCQSIEDPTQWLITSEWAGSDEYLEWVDSAEHQEMVKPLHGCVRGTRSLRFAVARETSHSEHEATAGRTQQKPQPKQPKQQQNRPAGPQKSADGITRAALSFPVKPGSESKVAEILAAYDPPDPHVDASTTLHRTSVFLHGTQVVRAIEIQGDMRAALAHVARQPQVRAAEEALNPFLVEARDLDDPEAARQFFMSAALAEAFRGASPDAAKAGTTHRAAFRYPVRRGAAEEAAKLLAEHDKAALAEPDGLLLASSIYVRQDILVRVVDLREPVDADPAIALGVDRSGPAPLARLLDFDFDAGPAGDAGLARLRAACTMTPVTDRRAADAR